MSDRQERRRRQHDQRRKARRGGPTIIVGEGIVAGATGVAEEAIPMAKLPPKRPGRHRWIAAASYALTDVQAQAAYDPDTVKYLDHESLFYIGIGCWDCEQPLPAVGVDSRCPADGGDD